MTTTMTWIEDIRRMATDHDGEVSRQWLENSRKETPYCVLPALLYLKRCGVKGNEDVLAQLAIIHPDRHALALMLGEDATAFSAFTQLEKLPESPDTITAIDRFLDNYGKTNPGEVEAISRAIFNPQPDYADVLAAQEKEEGGMEFTDGDSQDDLINQFIAEQMQLTIENPTNNDDSMLSESLAKMYIARHKYSQALEIIERLSLKFPEKSIYFADQIRFLQKLVLNETLNYKK